jgi:hypothetical protein
MKRHSPLWAVFVTVLFFSAAVLPVFSQVAAPGGRSRGDYLTVKIAVTGPGDEVYFWWGHIALVIDDAVTGQSRFYDWGVFSFDADHFFVNFAFGRLLYRCSASLAESSFRVYRNTNRDITIYTLDLPGETKEEIRRFAEWNILPENRNYYYHHFKDNCATRIRDILDTATGGQFRAAFGEAPGRFTLRQHVRRHTWFSPFFDWILNFWMGQDIDTPLTVWQEMFLPQEIANRIRDFTYTDPEGRVRKFVTSVEVLNRAVNRPPVLEFPRKQWPRELAVGIAAAVILVIFMHVRRKKPIAGRILLGVSQAVLGLFFGVAGSLLFFMSFFTNHDYTYHNSNIIYINPLLLAAVPLGIMMAKGPKNKGETGGDSRSGRFSPERLLRVLWTYVFLGGILTMVMKILPWFYQQNQVDLALILPFALVLSSAPSLLGRLFRRGVRQGV